MSHRRPADPRNVPSPRGPAVPSAALAPAAALALGAALVLGAPGEAAAQGVCAGDLPTVPNSNVGGVRIVCQESNPSASGIRINAESVSLSVTSSNFAFRPAIDARLNSDSDENDVNVRLGRGLVISTGAAREAFIGAYARNAGSGGTFVVMEDDASITTTGGDADGIRFSNPTAATGTSDIQMTGGSITTSGSEAHGIYILHNGSGASTVSMSGGAIKASGSRSSGIYVNKQRGSGDATITFSGGSIEKSGGDGAGIRFYGDPAANAANARIRVTGGSIAVEGIANTHGVHVDHRGAAGGGDVAMTGGSITTKGLNSHGVFATLRNAANEAPVVIGMAGGSITTEGQTALGLYGIHFGLGSVTVTMEGEAEVTTSGDGAHGVSALLFNAANEAAIVVGMAGGSVATEGAGAAGLNGLHLGLGSVTVTTGGEAEIESPFFVGVRGWLSNDANAAGRLVVTHGGAVEAGDVGVLAWAARRSGHTSGDGAEEADDAARTEPMIHVTSSGDVTVGASVTDAFIRNRITGGDGTLSAGERAVLDAIKADDSEALTRALEALPADYDDDWKAEAENLRRKRAVLTDDETSANRAAGKILGLTRAGVRALALSHETITGHVRFGDGDDALSPAERTALEAALTGDGLETALAALPAAYTDTWKDTLRAHAASYNAGDIQVDVTGGTIAAEGDGVDARYALAHDRNGAIAVTVADGAEITGGRHGVHVGGAGLAAGGGLRDQTVTVNGAVMGGTGAGVHLAGGGTVRVGRTGRVGAASGVGILSDGAGGLAATVAGTVEGHVRAQGGGDLTVTVEREGEITGEVRAQDGGDLSATVAGTVKGDLRAMDGGDLSATISGTVEGDLRAVGGGALTVDVQEGGEVIGTVHDPAGPLTVHGSIGRLLYANGGTVTVVATGKLTGVEVEGGTEALRSEAGDLDVTVAEMGKVTGNIRGMGGGGLSAMVAGTVTGDVIEEGAGDLDATVSGTVEGNVFGRGTGEHTVTVSNGGTVRGTIHLSASTVSVDGTAGRVRFDNGGMVRVGGTGKLTGVEVEGGREAVRSEAGDLAVTVAAMGTVTGDVRGLGDGDLSATVAGTVTGDVIEEGAGDLNATISGTVEGDLRAMGGGALTVDVKEGGEVTGTVHDPAGPLTVAGSIGRLLYTNGGTVTVAATGKLTGVEVEGGREAVRSESGDLDVTVAGTVTGDVIEEDAGDLDATVSGTVEGDVLGRGRGQHTVTVSNGGTVRGTIHLSASTVSVDGTAGRVRFDNGGMVTVGGTGKLTGVEGETEAVRSEAGDLDVTVAAMGTVTGDVRGLGDGDLSATVAGTVTGDVIKEGVGALDATVSGTVEGDLRAMGGGALTVDVKEGGTVTGNVHDPAGPLTVAGSIGRLLYTNGGTVTVSATGKLTGVEVEGGTEALRSEAGDLDVTVAAMGTVTGNVRGLGAGALSAMVAGTVTGDVIEEGAGDLDATVSGTVEGNVFGRGTGEHTVTVSNGGTVRGTIHLSASTVSVDGTAGRVRFDNGGMVTVGGTGKLTGVEVEGGREAVRSEAGDLDVTVAAMGTVTGNIRGLGAGTLSAMVAGTVTGDVIEEGAGDLDATISGTVEGNVFGRGTGEHTVTVSNGGTVRGTIHLAASPVTVHGTAGRVRFDEGGTVTVGGTGRITGIEVEGGREAIRSEAGDLKVTLHEHAGETRPQAADRIEGTIRNDPKGSLELCYVPAGGGEECASGPAPTVPQGAWDVRLRPEGGGVYQVENDIAPRSRLYEALPSVLLGLNAPARYEERMAAARAEQGGWARVETMRGKWKADASTSQKLSASEVELEYDHRRHGLQAGMDVAAGEDGLFGVSLHHRRGSADVSKGGKVELSGHGVGVSGAWGKGGVYVDVQAEATQYEADFRSSRHGVLKQDVSGHGYALGVEAGRRFALDGAPAGMVLTPRAGLVHSRVSVGDFTDAVGTRVSLEDGRSLKGRAGMVVEVKPQWWARGSRVFGSVDVERELSKDRKVRVSGTELRSEADATWLRFGLNGSHALDDGRWTVAGRVGWATSGGSDELGGGLHLKMRF